MSIVIAVDGTAASGKGTLAKKLAAKYGFHYLDTGALYRLTAVSVCESGGDPNDAAAAAMAARTLDPTRTQDPAIRTAEAGAGASIVSAHPEVRAALLDFQRRFAAQKPGAILDGRDIGTVVCPTAVAKLFVDARPEVRAHRRWLELKDQGPSETQILDDIRARDDRDRNRAIAPLKPAADARLLDTSDLDIEQAFAAALDRVDPLVQEALATFAQG